MSRHPGVAGKLRWLTTAHLPPRLQDVVSPVQDLAVAMVTTIPVDSDQLTEGLGLLVKAKDAFVRAAIIADEAAEESKRHDAETSKAYL